MHRVTPLRVHHKCAYLKMHLTKRSRVRGMGVEDFRVLWLWGFCGDSYRFFGRYGMGMGGLKYNPHGSPGFGPWLAICALSLAVVNW